jgi:hypothetical protein
MAGWLGKRVNSPLTEAPMLSVRLLVFFRIGEEAEGQYQ